MYVYIHDCPLFPDLIMARRIQQISKICAKCSTFLPTGAQNMKNSRAFLHLLFPFKYHREISQFRNYTEKYKHIHRNKPIREISAEKMCN